MSEKKNNGDFLRCVQELEASVPEELRPVWRKVAVHIVSLEQDVRQMIDDHTDPATGQPFDVRSAYAMLGRLEKREAEREKLDAQIVRALHWAQGGVVLASVLMPALLGLGIYIWHATELQVRANTKAAIDLAQAMERTNGLLNVMSIRIDQMEARRREDHGNGR